MRRETKAFLTAVDDWKQRDLVKRHIIPRVSSVTRRCSVSRRQLPLPSGQRWPSSRTHMRLGRKLYKSLFASGACVDWTTHCRQDHPAILFRKSVIWIRLIKNTSTVHLSDLRFNALPVLHAVFRKAAYLQPSLCFCPPPPLNGGSQRSVFTDVNSCFCPFLRTVAVNVQLIKCVSSWC